MNNDANIREQGYRYFLQEAPELLQSLEQDLLSLREDFSINKVNNLMRATHTLKGAAASVGLETIKTVAHSLEDIFKALCQPDLSIDQEVEALIFEGFECLRLPLTAELTGGQVNEAEVLDRTATVFAQLQEQLGDCFSREAHLPSSSELGFDVTQSIFEVGVSQRLEEVVTVQSTGNPQEIAQTLRTQAEVFLGLAESLGLPGFGAIAQAAIAALDNQPEQVESIARLATEDFLAGQEAVLNGDRSQGGQPSVALRNLAGLEFSATELDSATPENLDFSIENLNSELNLEITELDLIAPEIEEAENLDFSSENLDNEIASETTNSDFTTPTIEAPESLDFLTENLNNETASEINDSEFAAPAIEAPESLDFSPENLDNEIASETTDSHFTTPEIEASESLDFDFSTENTSSELEKEEVGNPLLESIWGGQSVNDSANVSTSDPTSAELASEEKQEKTINNFASIPASKEQETSKVRDKEKLITDQSAIPPREKLAPTVRVNVEHLEHLNYSVGELLTNQNQQLLQNEQLQAEVKVLLTRLQQHQQRLSELEDLSNRLLNLPNKRSISKLRATHSKNRTSRSIPNSSLAYSYERFDALELDRYSEAQLAVQSVLDDAVQLAEAADAIDLFARNSHQTLEKQCRLLNSTRDALMEARMLPLGAIFSRFPRILRQLEILHDKPVSLELYGSDVLVEKAVAEKLYDPLLHLLRNAFDHGIESLDVRQQLGKANYGEIAIRAYHRGSYLVIEVEDDGQGLDFEEIYQRALDKNLLPPETGGNLDQHQLTDLLFKPGFSTASEVSHLSGRGVGLDVVRSQLQGLKGSIEVDSELHHGTTFRLQIPLSLTIAKLLLFQTANWNSSTSLISGERIYALFAEQVEQIIIPRPEQIQSWSDGKALRWGKDADEQLIPIYQLSQVLNYSSPLPEPSPHSNPQPFALETQAMPILLIRSQEQLFALEVNQLLGDQELVIRPLGSMIAPPSFVYGGSIMADGRLTLVLDGKSLIEYLTVRENPDGRGGLLAKTTGKATTETLEYTNAYWDATSPSSPILAPEQQQRQLPPTRKIPNDFGVKSEKTILVVDDSITVRQTLAFTLEKAGYQVLQAKDGYEGIEQTQRHQNIDLVICDIEMPRLNGFEFLKYRQQDAVLGNIPVVLLTSRSGDKHRFLAQELGANDYITKPYLEHKLLAMLTEIVEKQSIS